MAYNPVIEDWWRHNGCYDREQASGIQYCEGVTDVADYLEETDDWWDNLTDDEKQNVYDNFFGEI